MPLRDLSAHPEYVPGRGATAVAAERGLDPDTVLVLSSNENALGPSPSAIAAVERAAAHIHRYPKSSHQELTELLAESWAVTPEQIWLANGGDGALDYLSRALLDPGDRVLVPDPGFAYYEMSARFHHGEASTYPVKKSNDFSITAESVLACFDTERIIYLTSPHNPTGSIISVGDIEQIAEETPDDTVVIVDEAYGAYASVESAVSLVKQRSDVAVLQSFSKIYGLAGIRLGYAVVPEQWKHGYSRVNTPFAVSELACRAGIAALDDSTHAQQSVEMANRGRQMLRDNIRAKSWPSEGNFVLIDVGDAKHVTEALFDQGIIVRDCTSFGLDSCIRVTVAPEDALARAIAAINSILDSMQRGDM